MYISGPARIAIDGPSGVGKTTVGRLLAQDLRLPFLDTGTTYRFVAVMALRAGRASKDIAAVVQIARDLKLQKELRNGFEEYLMADVDWNLLKSTEVAAMASDVATIPQLREILVAKQRQCSRRGIVMVGRDIGTVVLRRGALAKLFLTAPPAVRARRITGERGGEEYEQVLAKMQARDEQDSSRKDSPLSMAEDAVAIDTAELTPEEVAEKIKLVIAERKSRIAQ